MSAVPPGSDTSIRHVEEEHHSMNDTERYQRARARTEQLRTFYMHVASFVLVNIFLFIVDLITSPHTWWFYWVVLTWGIGLAAHAVNVFGRTRVFSTEWEEKKIRQYMNEGR
jgi:hypothetical protein